MKIGVRAHKFGTTAQEPRSHPCRISIGALSGECLNKGRILLCACVLNQNWFPVVVRLRLAHHCPSSPRARRYSSTTVGSETWVYTWVETGEAWPNRFWSVSSRIPCS